MNKFIELFIRYKCTQTVDIQVSKVIFKPGNLVGTRLPPSPPIHIWWFFILYITGSIRWPFWPTYASFSLRPTYASKQRGYLIINMKFT